MICNKCGTENNESQVFCLKCGNPMQLMADFNLIEKELASSIDEFMNEMESEEKEPFSEEGQMKTIDVPFEDINMELKVMDVSRNATNEESIDNETVEEDEIDELFDEEDITPVYVSGNKSESKKNSKKNDKAKDKNNGKKKKKSGGFNFGIIVAVIAIIAVIAVAVSMLLDGDSDKKPVEKNFSYYYDIAYGKYNANDLGNALDNTLLAIENAKTEEEKINARTLLKNIYEAQNFTGDYYMANLEELFKLGENSQENAIKLVEYYASKNNTDGLLTVFDYISEDNAKEILGETFVEKPTVNLSAGQYNNFISFELSAASGNIIYYAIDKTDDVEYQVYAKEIEISELGKHTVVAYAVDEQGIPSYKLEVEYNIVEGESAGPNVSPADGTYNEPTEITIVVPEGYKAFYTYDGTEPTINSTEYKEPVEMLRNANTFKAILVDKFGNVSEVTKVQYNLKLARNETIDSGKTKVWEYYYNNGKIDQNGNQADGSVIEVSYNTVKVIGNAEYYIYQVVATLTDGEVTTTTAVTYCGVNTYDGTAYVGLIEDGDNFIIPEVE